MKSKIYIGLAAILAVSSIKAHPNNNSKRLNYTAAENIELLSAKKPGKRDAETETFKRNQAEKSRYSKTLKRTNSITGGECEAEPGSLIAVQTPVCLDPVESTAIIEAIENTAPTVPTGYESEYLLSEGTEYIIVNSADIPSFEVTTAGTYTIHTLVYNPATFDINNDISFGKTTGNDIADMFVQGGGFTCGAIDATGAQILVEDCDNTGINEQLNEQLSVFPNPNNGQFVIDLKSNVGQGSVQIADLAGRRIFQRDVFLNGQFRLDLELNVAPGTYVLHIITPEGTATRTVEIK